MLNKQQNIINKIKNKTKSKSNKTKKKKGPTNSFTSLKHAHGENLFYIFKIVHLKLVTLQVQWWTLRLSIILHNLTSSIWVCFFFFLNSAKYFIQECTWMGVLQTKKYITKVTANRKKTQNKWKKKIQAVQGNCHRQQNLSSLRSKPQSNTEPGFLWFFLFI